MEADYYALLGVERDADLETITAAYRAKAVEYHPDRGGSTKAMQLINIAWETLSNPEQRRIYDDAFVAALERLFKTTFEEAMRDNESSHGAVARGAWIRWFTQSWVATCAFMVGGFLIGAQITERIMQMTSLLSDGGLANSLTVIFGGAIGAQFGDTLLERISERVSVVGRG